MSAPLIPTGTVTRIRRAVGAYGSDGGWSDGAETLTPSISASVQPASGRDLQRLEEGLRSREVLKVYTASGLWRAPDQRTGTPGDLVDIDGARYEVHAVATQRAVIPHDRILVVRQAEGTT